MRLLYSLSLLVVFNLASAQSPLYKKKLVFSSINSIGLLSGSSGDNFTVQTINGVRCNQWNIGVGTGLDWYGIRTIPLVADVRRYFTKNKNQPFLYANGGISFVWAKTLPETLYYTNKVDYKRSFCGEVGLGYKVALKNATSLALSAGYSYKKISFDQYYYAGIRGTELKETYSYNYRRIALRIGLQF